MQQSTKSGAEETAASMSTATATTTTTTTTMTKTTTTMTTTMTTMTTMTMTVTVTMTMTMATATVTAVMMTTMRVAAPFVAPAVGWLLHCSPPPAIVVTCCTLSCDCRRSCRQRLSPPLPLQLLVITCIVVRHPILSSPVNVRYSIPSSPSCPQTLSLPAAARLCHSR